VEEEIKGNIATKEIKSYVVVFSMHEFHHFKTEKLIEMGQADVSVFR